MSNANMILVRALLVLGLSVPLLGSKKGQAALVESGRVKGQTVRLILDSSVKPKIVTTSGSATANMSLSPWIYKQHCVESRVPRCIAHTQCLTSGCINPQWGGEDLSLEAKPIYYQVLVLYRVQRQKLKSRRGKKSRMKYDFRLGTEVVSVGCTCVRPSVLPQQ